MKASFFSLAALVATAFAAPATNGALQARATGVADALTLLDGLVIDKLGVGQIVEGATKGASKRDITKTSDLTGALSSTISKLKTQGSSIQTVLDSVKSGKTTKAEGTTKTVAAVSQMHYTLTDIVTDITSAAGLVVAKGDVDTVLNLVVELVSIVLDNVKVIVTVLGLTPQLTSLLHSLLAIVSKLLVAVIGLVSALLPGLIAALSPLLAGLGNGLLAPILTPIVALLAGLAVGA